MIMIENILNFFSFVFVQTAELSIVYTFIIGFFGALIAIKVFKFIVKGNY